MRLLFAGLLFVAAVCAGEAPAGVEVPVIENAGYGYCVSEANYALTLGRMVTVFKRPRQEVEQDPKLAPYLRGMAVQYYEDLASGRARNYVDFAMHRFQECLAAQKVHVEAGNPQIFGCLARMDIPYFFLLLERMGDSKADAIGHIESTLQAWHYPRGLVAATADSAWSIRSEDELKGMQAFLFNSCLLPPEQVSHYYGIPLPPGVGSGKTDPAPALSPKSPGK